MIPGIDSNEEENWGGGLSRRLGLAMTCAGIRTLVVLCMFAEIPGCGLEKGQGLGLQGWGHFQNHGSSRLPKGSQRVSLSSQRPEDIAKSLC